MKFKSESFPLVVYKLKPNDQLPTYLALRENVLNIN